MCLTSLPTSCSLWRRKCDNNMDKIAERVFALKRADLGKLREYGFKENEEGEFCLSCDIAEGRMRLGITVAADGSVRTKVTDVDTDDPYTLYLVEDAVGGSCMSAQVF